MVKKKQIVKKERSVKKEVPLQAAYSVHSRSEDVGWRRLTGKKVDRDLSALTQEKMQNIAVYLYDSDPLAKRILDTKRDFLVGEGIQVEAADPEVNKIVQSFWNDPINQMDLKLNSKALELGLFGEQIYPVFVNKENGHVRLGYLDPTLIERVVANPENCEELIGLKIKEISGNSQEVDSEFTNKWRTEQGLVSGDESKRYYSIIGLNRNPNSPKFGLLDGECFFFAINKVSTATRGRSDILSLADWIYNYEQFLFARVERARLLNFFLWDVALQGATEEQIKQFLKSQSIPKPGTLRAHNEKVKWEAITPKLESSDASEEAKLFRSHIAGGSGIPVHFLGGGEGLTRACYSEDTETLTENGWKKYWEIKRGEKIATFNPDKDSIEFHKPKEFFLYDYEGEMYHFKNTRTDILVTPEHKMWIRGKASQSWRKIMAKDISLNSFYIKEGANNWLGEKKEYFNLPYIAYDLQSGKKDNPRTFKMTDWVEFLGWYLSEGWLNKREKHFSVRIAQKDKRNIEIINSLLKRLGFQPTKSDNGKDVTVFGINNKSLFSYLKENVGNISKEKRIPKDILQLDKCYLQILFKAMMAGDGSWDKRKGRNCFDYSTNSKQLADDFQILCLLLGYSTRQSISRKGKFSWNVVLGSKTLERNLKTRVSVNNRGVHYPSNIEKIKYKGKVYCFEIPNALFVTRRNSKIAIQSNTALEMGAPFYKQLKCRQLYLKHMIGFILRFVIDQAIIYKKLDMNVDKTVHISMPALSQKDLVQLATSLSSIANACVLAIDSEIINKEEASTVFKFILGLLGTDIRVPTEGDTEAKEEYPNAALKQKLGL